MYNWRRLSDTDRRYVLNERKVRRFPWHAPPHFKYTGERKFLITAACFEHKHVIGKSFERMIECESQLISIATDHSSKLFAWCVLPNHYHLLVQTEKSIISSRP